MARSDPATVIVSLCLCCSCSTHHPASVPVATTTTVTPGTRTVVSTTREAKEPPNDKCLQYCERLSACHDAVSYLSPVMSGPAVREKCEQDEGRCYRATTETDCCGTLDDCQSFARCQAQSRAVITDCEPGRAESIAARSSPPPTTIVE